MDIQTRKIAFVQEFLKLDNEKKIAQLEHVLRTEEDERFQPMSMEELDKRMDQSEEYFRKGKYKGNEELIAKYYNS